jgi:hypothetical protein
MKQLAQSIANMFGSTVSYQDKDGARTVAKPGIMKINIEVTDTFGHEPNYGWVRRATLEAPDLLSRYACVRRAKAAVGWTGKRTVTVDYGDMIELRPHGECLVCFITFN